jgi:hypothetical protein
MTLSQKRAESAVQYIVSKGVNGERISAKGYGEEKILNVCTDGVNCSEPEHQRNRRTEFTVTGILKEDPYETKSLREIIEEQAFMDMVLKGGDMETIQVGADGKIPEQLQKDIDKQQKRDTEIHNKTENTIAPPAPNPVTITSKTEPVRNVAPTTAPTKKVEKAAEAPSGFVSRIKPNPDNYTGFRVQLLTVKNEPLPANHPIQFEFPEVYQEAIAEKEFAYLIGDYKSMANANVLFKQMSATYENAKIIRYKNGKRVM